MQAIEQSPLVSRAHAATVCGVPTRFVLTLYANRIFVIITQTQNLGTLIMAEADDPMNVAGTSYSTRVVVGRRDDDVLEAYARTLVELMCKRVPEAGPLLLAISIKEHSQDTFRGVMQEMAALVPASGGPSLAAR